MTCPLGIDMANEQDKPDSKRLENLNPFDENSPFYNPYLSIKKGAIGANGGILSSCGEKPLNEPEVYALVREFGEDPFSYLVDQVNEKGIKIIGLGELYGQPATEKMFLEALKRFHHLGIRIGALAVDEIVAIQPQIDEFLQGKIAMPSDVQRLSDFYYNRQSYVDTLLFARDNNIKVVCVRNEGAKTKELMQDMVSTIHQEHPNELTLFYAGNGYVDTTRTRDINPRKSFPSSFDDRYFSVGQYFFDLVKAPVLLPTNISHRLQRTPIRWNYPRTYGAFNAVICLPASLEIEALPS